MPADPCRLALQIGYGATILSFLGGVHWGLAMTNVGGEALLLLARLVGREIGQVGAGGRGTGVCWEGGCARRRATVCAGSF